MTLNISPLDGQAKKYIPTFLDERKKAQSDPNYQPLIFHLRAMNAGEAERYDEFKTRFDPESGLVAIEPRPDIDAEIFASHVSAIENLTVGDTPIRTAADYLAARERLPRNFLALFREILTAIREVSALTEGEAKN
jgi:hypothetical protein